MDAFRTPKGWKEEVDVTVLKVIDPCHFLIREAPGIHMSDCARAFLNFESRLREYMSKHDVEPVIQEPPELGARVLVQKQKDAEWYRAVVNCTLETLQGYRIQVTLIDYGETLLVSQRNIRKAPACVFTVPAQSVELILPGLKPCTLALNDMTFLTQRPADEWDTAAVEHVQMLIASAGAAQVHVFGQTKSGKLYGKLTLRYGDTTVCVAQDLLSKAYAFLDNVSSAECEEKDEASQTICVSMEVPVVSVEKHMAHKERQQQQEQAMAAAMEQIFYGSRSSSKMSSPLPLFLKDDAKNRMPEETSSKESLVPDNLSGEFHNLTGPGLLEKHLNIISPSPSSFSSKTLTFFDFETSTTASAQPTSSPCSGGQGHTLPLPADSVEKICVKHSSVTRPGDAKRDAQFGVCNRLPEAISCASDCDGFRNTKKTVQPCVSPGGACTAISSSRGINSGVPNVLPPFGVQVSMSRNAIEDKSMPSELKSLSCVVGPSEHSPSSSECKRSFEKAASGCTKLIALLQQEQDLQKKSASTLYKSDSSDIPQVPLSDLSSMLNEATASVRIPPGTSASSASSERSLSKESVASEFKAEKLKQLLSRSCDAAAFSEASFSSASPHSEVTTPSCILLPNQLESKMSLHNMSPSKTIIGFGDSEVCMKAVECTVEVGSPRKDSSLLSAAGVHSSFSCRARWEGPDVSEEDQEVSEFSTTLVNRQLQRGGEDGDVKTKAPANQSEKEGESVLPASSYDDFIRDWMTDSEEQSSDEEAENKWSPQFRRGNHQELMSLSVCNDSEDFRRHDFNSFSDVPPDLEPYTQFEGEVHFSTSFEPSNWAARIDNKLIRALSHGSAVPRPILSLDSARFPDSLKERLASLGFKGPSCVQSVVWPSVLSGRTLVEVTPPNSGKTLSYLLPLLSRVVSETDYRDLPVSSGPLVLVLSSTSKGAQRIYNQLMVLIQDTRVPRCCVLYAGGSEFGKEIQLTNGCDFLVATPSSFLRMLRTYNGKVTNLRRCCHLVFDDGERLIEEFTKEVSDILTEYWSAVQQRASVCPLSQIIVCSTRWTTGLQALVQLLHDQQSPLVFFTSFFEAAVYGQVPTFAHFVSAQMKSKALLDLVEGCVGKKTVICTSTYEAAMLVHKLLEMNCIYTLLLHDKLIMTKIWDVAREWASPHDSHSIPILVAMDNTLSWANVRDAAAIIHYDVPELSKFIFGFRFSCLAERIHSIYSTEVKDVDIRERPVAHLLLTPDDQVLSVPLVSFLKRLGSKIPPGLQELADRELEMRTLDEEQPLCHNFKAFGRCEAQEFGTPVLCRSRHQPVAHLDHPKEYDFLPAGGEVKVFITRVVDASLFYGWVLEHREPGPGGHGGGKKVKHTQHFTLMDDLSIYFAKSEHRKNLEHGDVPTVGSVYALEVKENHYQRVRVTSVSCRSELEKGKPLKVEVFHIDHGFSSMTFINCLLHLPESLASQPPYAVEVFCCRIQPQDRDTSWTFQANFAAENLVAGKELYGKVALCMGSTLWLDPLVICKRLETVGVMVNEKMVRFYLIQSGLACDNPHHLTRLRKAAEKAGIPVPRMKAVEHQKSETADTGEDYTPSPSWAFLEMEEYSKAYMWKVISPEYFYVQREKFSSCLERLEDEMQKHVAAGKLRRPRVVRTGMLCVAPFSNNRFYRAQVEEVSQEGKSVTVFFPDYGDTMDCLQKDLFCVEPWMILLPFQGIECSLAGIAPPEGGWDINAAARLEDMSYSEGDLNKELLVKALRSKKGSRPRSVRYEVLIYDSTLGCGISLADQLVHESLAKAVEIAVPDVNVATGTSQTAFSLMATPATDQNQSMSHDMDLEPEDEVCVEAMQEHMNKIYSEMCDYMLQNFTEEERGQDVAQHNTTKKETTDDILPGKPKDCSIVLPAAGQPPPLDFCGRSQNSRQPIIKWWQDKQHVYLDILVAGVKTFSFTVRSQLIVFRTKVKSYRYEVYEELYAAVLSESSTTRAKPTTVRVTLEKETVGLQWPMLTNRGYKVNYISYDLDHITDSDEERVDENCNLYPLGYEKPSTVLHYDPVAHEDAILEKEDTEEHIHAPVEDLYNDSDPNDPFA